MKATRKKAPFSLPSLVILLLFWLGLSGTAWGSAGLCPVNDPAVEALYEMRYDLTATHADDNSTLPLRDTTFTTATADRFYPIVVTKWQADNSAYSTNDPNIAIMKFRIEDSLGKTTLLQQSEKGAPYDANGGDFSMSTGIALNTLTPGAHAIYAFITRCSGAVVPPTSTTSGWTCPVGETRQTHTLCTQITVSSAVCGNGIVEKDEICDDGNTTPGDGCDGFCLSEVCGNGIVQFGEECDDKNIIDNDGCSHLCKAQWSPSYDSTQDLDFQKDGDGNPLVAGTMITNQFKGMIIQAMTKDNTPALAVIFDSAHPVKVPVGHVLADCKHVSASTLDCGDPDLGTPHHDFGGAGEGLGGAALGIAPNTVAEGNLLIINESNPVIIDGIVQIPSDEGNGGTLRFDFDNPKHVYALRIIDIDSFDVKNLIYVYTNSLETPEKIIPVGQFLEGKNGDNGSFDAEINMGNVNRLELKMVGSGALARLRLEDDLCPADPAKTKPEVCGCGIADIDSDSDGILDCLASDGGGGGGGGSGEDCTDTDGDTFCDPDDNCISIANDDQIDTDSDGKGDACDDCTPTSQNDATCDGVDNDCADGVDEDYSPVTTSCGTGACVASATTS
ncbi:MAG: DUF4215 domain-containing protein [Deltaproteobacteria bacterium]|nr:DUF4215 domain-containing protein [Deltaproteobacteria bacterium]